MTIEFKDEQVQREYDDLIKREDSLIEELHTVQWQISAYENHCKRAALPEGRDKEK